MLLIAETNLKHSLVYLNLLVLTFFKQVKKSLLLILFCNKFEKEYDFSFLYPAHVRFVSVICCKLSLPYITGHVVIGPECRLLCMLSKHSTK